MWVGALVGSLLLFLACVGLVVAMRQRGGLEKDQSGYMSTSTTETEVKEKDDTLWIDRRWNNVDSGGKYSNIKSYIWHFFCNYSNIFVVSPNIFIPINSLQIFNSFKIFLCLNIFIPLNFLQIFFVRRVLQL